MSQHPFAREDGRMYERGERVLMDRYPQQDALAARVISECPHCHVVELYEINTQIEDNPIFQPAIALVTVDEWGQYNNPDWPDEDGWSEYVHYVLDA